MVNEDILKLVPVEDIAAKFGVSTDEARAAVEQGGAALLSGLAKNAESAEGSAAIQKALGKHETFTGAHKVDEIDTSDGGKIVHHVFDGKEDEVAEKLTASDKTAGIDFGKLLPILAPIVMGLIANGTKTKSGATEASGGGIGDLLGGLLGGGNTDTKSSSGGGLGDILGGIGGMLGGGKNTGSGGGIDIGGLLGGLLGGKK